MKLIRPFWIQGLACLILVLGCGCDKISIPRFSYDQGSQSHLSISVTYVFDPALSAKTVDVDACSLPYTLPVGKIIKETFLEEGQKQFSSVMAQPEGREAIKAAAPSNLTIHLSLQQFTFRPTTRSGEEDRYEAAVTLHLQALYQDAQGNDLAQTPLSYEKEVRVWVPALGNTSINCATGQFDAIVKQAAEALAKDMGDAIPQLYGQPAPAAAARRPSYPPPYGQTRVPTPSYPAPVPQQQVQVPSLAFRTLLKDGNDNLILEGGETIVLHLETTNTGTTSIPSASVQLSGTQDIIDAFASVTPLPIPIGPFQPGEKRTTEIRGKMPFSIQEQRGELVVTLSLPGGSSPGSHRIFAALRPGVNGEENSKGQRRTQGTQQGKATKSNRSPDESPYFALIVGMDHYRDPWPKAHKVARRDIQGLVDALQTSGTFPKRHIRLLHGNHATRTDIEEALFTWARPQLHDDSIFLFYFAGQALTDPHSGEVYLVPYEGSPKASKKRLISLRILQKVLRQFHGNLSLLILDIPFNQYLNMKNLVGVDGKNPPRWNSGLKRKKSNHIPHVIQIKRVGKQRDRDPAKLLAGLLGQADRNQDGTITVFEFIEHLKGKADIFPHLSSNTPQANIPLAQ